MRDRNDRIIQVGQRARLADYTGGDATVSRLGTSSVRLAWPGDEPATWVMCGDLTIVDNSPEETLRALCDEVDLLVGKFNALGRDFAQVRGPSIAISNDLARLATSLDTWIRRKR